MADKARVEHMHFALKDYGSDIDWNVGSLFCHEASVFRTLNLCKAFSIPHPIKWAFGSLASPMSGGRASPVFLAADDAKAVFDSYMAEGIACRLTLSNPYVDMQMVRKDALNAELMAYLNANGNGIRRNGVIVVSDILAMHIKDAYPNLEVILSTIRAAYDTGYGKDKDTMEYYVNMLKNPLYDVVVVNAAKIYEEDFMEDLPFKSKVELLACHDCIRNCPYAKMHYEAMLAFSQCIVNGTNGENANSMLGDVMKRCIRNKQCHLDQTASYTADEIRHLALLGYRQFKLSGRMNSEERFARDLDAYLFKHEVLRYIETAIP